MGKKKFIEKKKSATYQLLARDSSDVNYEEEGGPSVDRVFVRVDNNQFSVNSFFDEDPDNVDNDSNSIFADAPEDEDDGSGGEVFQEQVKFGTAASGTGSLPDHVKREILELGFPDDGYNYLLHLRTIKNTGGGSAYYENSKAKTEQLPPDVKAYDASRVQISLGDPSEKEIYSVASKTVGVRIQKVADPEVLALLDDDSDLSRFGSDVEDIEEDFVVIANLPEEDDIENVEYDNKSSSIDAIELNNKKEHNDSKSFSPQYNLLNIGDAKNQARSNLSAKEDNVNEKPRVRRPLDEQFDMLELQEYFDETESDHDDYNGSTDDECHESLPEKLNHALKGQAIGGLELNSKYRVPSDLVNDNNTESKDVDSPTDVILRCKEIAKKYENENEDENVVVVVEESTDEPREKWDCETILTTMSNLDNHPGIIAAPDTRRKKKLSVDTIVSRDPDQVIISLKGKQKLPVVSLPGSNKKSVTEKVKNDEKEPLPRKQLGHESKEEKKERKAAVKEERREARRLKKETKELYSSVAHRAQRTAAISGPSSIHLM